MYRIKIVRVIKILLPLGIWFIMAIIAIINAAIRELSYGPKLGEPAGHAISSIIFICILFFITYLFLAKTKVVYSAIDLIWVGVFWLLLTLMFEFLFGHYVMGNPWEVLLAYYNIFKGRLWSLVLVSELTAPSVVGLILRSRKE